MDAAKEAAARKALEVFVADDMTLALGSGSTAHAFVRALGEAVAGGLAVTCTASSRVTESLARSVGIACVEPVALARIDLCVDGADEIDAKLRMIKGGGACLLWEKILGRTAERMVCIVDEGKRVDRLGRFPLPLEVVPFGWTHTARTIGEVLRGHAIRPESVLRRMTGSEPLMTDSGNYILDCRCGEIPDPVALEVALNTVPGVVENGLFSHVADHVVVGRADGSAEVSGR